MDFAHLGLPCPCCPTTRPTPPTSLSGSLSVNSENSSREASQVAGLVEGSSSIASLLPVLESQSSAHSSIVPITPNSSSNASSFPMRNELINKGK